MYAKIYFPFITYKIQCKIKKTFRPQTKDLNGLSSVLKVQPVITADRSFSLDSLGFRQDSDGTSGVDPRGLGANKAMK